MTKSAILSELKRARRVLLLGHQDPDGDSAGSLLALAHALCDREVFGYSQGRLPSRYAFLNRDGRLRCELDLAFRPDLVVALEAASRERLGEGNCMIPDGVPLINIDHHRDNTAYGDINWLSSDAAALGEMIYELLTEGGYAITPEVATCLYTAILTDTGRFQYRGTSARTLACASDLVRCGADPTAITRSVYFGMPFSYLLLMQAALAGMEQAADGRILAMTLRSEHFARAGAGPQDAEGIVDLTQISGAVQIGILFREHEENRIKVSFRSQDAIDVGRLAAGFDGGGHRNASGCLIAGALPAVKSEVLRRATALVEAPA